MSTAIRDPREIIREEPSMHRPILDAVATGALTVPEIAAAVGHPADEVLFWVMGMRRYGHLVELGDADSDGYFRYGSTDKETGA
jgi:hypothetical protein